MDDELLPEARLDDQGLRQLALVVYGLAVVLAAGAGDEAVTQAVQPAVLLGTLVVAVSDLDPKACDQLEVGTLPSRLQAAFGCELTCTAKPDPSSSAASALMSGSFSPVSSGWENRWSCTCCASCGSRDAEDDDQQLGRKRSSACPAKQYLLFKVVCRLTGIAQALHNCIVRITAACELV